MKQMWQSIVNALGGFFGAGKLEILLLIISSLKQYGGNI